MQGRTKKRPSLRSAWEFGLKGGNRTKCGGEVNQWDQGGVSIKLAGLTWGPTGPDMAFGVAHEGTRGGKGGKAPEWWSGWGAEYKKKQTSSHCDYFYKEAN